jgi:hypothetical protein
MPNVFRVSIQNNGGYQKWSKFIDIPSNWAQCPELPDSPVLSSDYPFQNIFGKYYQIYLGDGVWEKGYEYYLSTSTASFIEYLNVFTCDNSTSFNEYKLIDGAWIFQSEKTNVDHTSWRSPQPKTNSDIYTHANHNAVEYEKNTTSDQDAGITQSLIQIA